MKTFIHNDWQEVLGPQFESAYYAHLHNFLKIYSQEFIFSQLRKNHFLTGKIL